MAEVGLGSITNPEQPHQSAPDIPASQVEIPAKASTSGPSLDDSTTTQSELPDR